MNRRGEGLVYVSKLNGLHKPINVITKVKACTCPALKIPGTFFIFAFVLLLSRLPTLKGVWKEKKKKKKMNEKTRMKT